MSIAELDSETLRRKYAEERAKRLRPDGNEQYIEPTGRFASFIEDPYVEVQPREPFTDETLVAFIGGGFAGLCTGARLKQEGIGDVRIIEKGGDFGGTWYWNRYPGAQCDTAAFIYLPMLEEVNHMPTEKYTHAPEILAHAKNIASTFNLYEKAVLSTEVTDVSWDDTAKRWVIRTNRGDEMKAKYLAMGTGPLHKPKLPGIPGIESFGGHAFHTSRWDYDYTGGDPAGALMTKLADKRVGIIGTGATSVQCVPHLAKACRELFVFQRTPSSIDVRNNHEIDPEWFRTLERGWQKEWLINFCTLQTGGFADEDLVKDGWTDIAKRIRDKVVELASSGEGGEAFGPELFAKAFAMSDDEKMNEIRARVDAVISDPETAEAMKPWYRQLCKRPCFHDAYLQAFNTPGTKLVDTDGKGVEAINEHGIVANGEQYDLDCIIFASGFEVGTEYTRRTGYDVTGRDQKLSEAWANGMTTLHGLHVHGFPNLFVVSPNQAANLISNIPHNLVEAGETIAKIVAHAQSRGVEEVEVTQEAQDGWISFLEANPRSFGGDPSCTPGYYNNEGKGADLAARRSMMGYPDGPVAFFEFIEKWRTSGEFEGLEFR